jgi:hypothetical protein
MLQTARGQYDLPDQSAPSGADILLAYTAPKLLARAGRHAIEANMAAARGLDNAHENFLTAAHTLRFFVGAPPQEHIDVPDGAKAAPSISTLNDLFSSQNLLGSVIENPYAGFDDDRLTELASTFDQATTAYGTARERKKATQQDVELGDQIRARRRQLVRTPRIFAALLTATLLGGACYAAEHTVQVHAQSQLAGPKTPPPGSERYKILFEQASSEEVIALGALGAFLGVPLGMGFAWKLDGEIARRRARFIVWRVQRADRPREAGTD